MKTTVKYPTHIGVVPLVLWVSNCSKDVMEIIQVFSGTFGQTGLGLTISFCEWNFWDETCFGSFEHHWTSDFG